jgi:hypothetical protein
VARVRARGAANLGGLEMKSGVGGSGDDHSRKLASLFRIGVECAQNAQSKTHSLRTGSGDQSSRNGNEKKWEECYY